MSELFKADNEYKMDCGIRSNLKPNQGFLKTND